MRPLRMPAKAEAPLTPGCQVSTMASANSSTRGISRARPLVNVTTTGFPVAFRASNKASWPLGSAMEEREVFSPLQFCISPMQ